MALAVGRPAYYDYFYDIHEGYALLGSNAEAVTGMAAGLSEADLADQPQVRWAVEWRPTQHADTPATPLWGQHVTGISGSAAVENAAETWTLHLHFGESPVPTAR